MSESHPSPERPHPLDHEGRIARLEGIVEQLDVRLGRIETKLDANDAKIDATRMALEDKIDKKFDSLLRWVIALQAATWGLIGVFG